jgi:hypothetical protein
MKQSRSNNASVDITASNLAHKHLSRYTSSAYYPTISFQKFQSHIWCMWSEIVISNIPEDLHSVTVVEWEDLLRISQQGMLAVDDCAAAWKQIRWLSWRLPSHHID